MTVTVVVPVLVFCVVEICLNGVLSTLRVAGYGYGNKACCGSRLRTAACDQKRSVHWALTCLAGRH